MKHNIIAAAILALGLVLAAFLYSGRYAVVVLDKGVALRLDKWTGKTTVVRDMETWWERQ